MSLEACVNMEPGMYEFDEMQLFENCTSIHVLGRNFDPKNGPLNYIITVFILKKLKIQIIISCAPSTKAFFG